MSDVPIYLDHAATTPLDPRVLDAMRPYLADRFGNAGSAHAFGQDARAAVDEARGTVARAIGARPSEIIFTSGATEADNLAVLGVALALEHTGRHLIVSSVEHHAVLEPAEWLASRGWEVTELPVDGHGAVDPDEVARRIRPDTVLVSVMHANNELGTIEPVAEIARRCRERGVLVHTDATQTVGAIPVEVEALGVDLLSLSGHKRYGPKGVGALFVRTGTPLEPLQRGGSQERGRRAGTENVAGAVGLARALEIALEVMDEEATRLVALRDRLIAALLAIPGSRLNGHPERRLPNNVNVSFSGTDSESLLASLDLEGVAGSAGSTCTSGSLEPSHVLRAIGAPDDFARGTVRLTLGRSTSGDDVARAASIVAGVVDRVRGAQALDARTARGHAPLP